MDIEYIHVPGYKPGMSKKELRGVAAQLMEAAKGERFCPVCGLRVARTRSVMIRQWLTYRPEDGGPDSVVYQQYTKAMTYRRAFICGECYVALDSPDGMAERENGERWNMSLSSRNGRAAVYDYKRWISYQRRTAAKMGVDFKP